MKKFGHTKTLFIQWLKYKWACHYDYCIECKWVKFKHKGRWLCTSCWDKERANNPKRIEIRQKAWKKWHEINKPRKPREEWEKMWPKPTWFDQKEYRKEWYNKWKVAILSLNRWAVRKKNWLPYIEYLWKPLPFESLAKPFDKNMTCTQKEYDKWKNNVALFEKIKKYLTK